MHLVRLGLIVASLGLALVGCAGPPLLTTAAPGVGTPTASPTPSPREIDRGFLLGMVVHHAVAIQMAQIEIQKGKRSEVKQLARQIVATQTHEITELQQIGQRDFNVTPSTAQPDQVEVDVLMGEPIVVNFKEEIAMLSAAADPDRTFLEMMIPHHAMAIVMADSQERYGSHAQLKTISQNIITQQAAEIGEMESLLAHR